MSWTTNSLFEDEDASFGRPAKHTRPRTKNRPDYDALPLGRVITIDRGRYRCVVDGTHVTAAKARALGKRSVIVGDLVRLDGDVSGAEGTLARIAEVIERTTVLRRTADDNDPYERPIVANADQVVIVTSLADPDPSLGMIDRVLVAAFDAGLKPFLALTKADLASSEDVRLAYEPLDVEIFDLQPGCDLSSFTAILTDRISVLVGHSGVGKSTLVNELVPDADRETGVVNDVTGKGRHTSTSAIALELPAGGWIIDTPGVRSFGLSHVDPHHILDAFSDLASFAEDCPRGCTHLADESECALDRAVETGKLSAARLDSFRRLAPLALTHG